MLFRDETRNNLCTEEQFVRDAFCGKDASLHAKMVVQGCIRGEEIIPAVKKSRPDAFCGKDVSLYAKMVVQGCIRGEEIIPVEEKSKSGMHPGRRNNPCRTKEQARDESGRKKSSLWKKRAR